MASFDDFFLAATGVAPYGYQRRIASRGLPEVVEAPTGAGKTGLVLAWLWRLLHGDPGGTPRRLVYALPQRALVEQVAAVVAEWLTRLGLTDRVSLHVVMGGRIGDRRGWRLDMHRPAIVVGTVDSLVSKALNRGYGIGRAGYPIDFALVTNGTQWIVDEVQLCPESTTTMRQVVAFAARLGTAEPMRLTCMTATVSAGLLETVDNPGPAANRVEGLVVADRTGELGRRLAGRRTVARIPGDGPSVAELVRERHTPGTLTLVVANTVASARTTYLAIRRLGLPCLLLHGQFRGVDREALMADLTSPDRIVVATQVIEAGIDISARLLVTEAAPWPALVQRAGRCNRFAEYDQAELWWLPPASHHPYSAADVAATVADLSTLEGVAVTGEELRARPVPVAPPDVAVLRSRDLLELFDTAPDLSGFDIDVAPYVRDAEDSDVELAWAVWDTAITAVPPAAGRMPDAHWRCRAPVGEVTKLLQRGVWRRDQAADRWVAVDGRKPPRPGEVLLMAAAAGGYDPELGLDATLTGPVPDCPPLEPELDRTTGAEEAFAEDETGGAWMSLTQHLEETRDHAAGLIERIGPAVSAEAAAAVVRAAYVHDVGKAHPIWQDALCALASPQTQERVQAGRPWAKSGIEAPLKFRDDVAFRHELASLLYLDGPLARLLDGMDDPDLVRYLALAHHGKLRVQVREPTEVSTRDGEWRPDTILGLVQGETTDVPTILGQPPGTLTVDLAPFSLGGERSWTRTALTLLDRYGPFVLAYLETLVRIADWRASAGMPVPQDAP